MSEPTTEQVREIAKRLVAYNAVDRFDGKALAEALWSLRKAVEEVIGDKDYMFADYEARALLADWLLAHPEVLEEKPPMLSIDADGTIRSVIGERVERTTWICEGSGEGGQHVSSVTRPFADGSRKCYFCPALVEPVTVFRVDS